MAFTVAELNKIIQAHEERDAERFTQIHDAMLRIEEQLKPMAEVYNSANNVGKWVMKFAVFISLVLGITWSIIQITRR